MILSFFHHQRDHSKAVVVKETTSLHMSNSHGGVYWTLMQFDKVSSPLGLNLQLKRDPLMLFQLLCLLKKKKKSLEL